MATRSIELTEDEENDLRELVAVTGESEAALIERVLGRGLKDLRIEQAVRAFKERGSSSEAAAIAGLPRAYFLQLLIDEGVEILSGPDTLDQELERLAEELGGPGLRDLVRGQSDIPA